jgi:hypothetical protein
MSRQSASIRSTSGLEDQDELSFTMASGRLNAQRRFPTGWTTIFSLLQACVHRPLATSLESCKFKRAENCGETLDAAMFREWIFNVGQRRGPKRLAHVAVDRADVSLPPATRRRIRITCLSHSNRLVKPIVVILAACFYPCGWCCGTTSRPIPDPANQ